MRHPSDTPPVTGPAPKVLYVCSAARCGSTVLDMFFGGHAQAASLGELNLIGKALRLGQMCTCGAALQRCPAWGRVFDHVLQARGVDLRADPYGLRLWDARARVHIDHAHQNAWRRRAIQLRKGWLLGRARLPRALAAWVPLPPPLSQAVDNKLALYQAISQAWGAGLIVDSSKNPWEAIELARRRPDQVRVVLLVRDGRGVYLSRRSSGFSQPDSVSGWRTYYQRVLPLLQRELPPDSWLQLHYEEFATDPAAVGKRLCQSVGLPFDPAMLDLGQGLRHMVNGNDTRFAPARGIRLDERWREGLVGDDLAFFQRHGGALNRALGYD